MVIGPTFVNFRLEEIVRRKERHEKARLAFQTAQPKQIVILDTNALFTLREDEIFSAKLSAELAQCRKLTSLRVFVPRVSLLERLFQKCHSVAASFKDAHRELSKISDLVGYALTGYEAPKDFRRHFYRRVLDWCEEKLIVVVRTPIKSINWNAVIRDSIWRKAPFTSYDPKSKQQTEKGFRDAMILATVNSIVAENTTRQVAFICNDKLLRETALKQNLEEKNFSAYPLLSNFLSIMKLANADVSRLLADVLIQEAAKVFSDLSDPESVYLKYNLLEQIPKDHGFKMNFMHQTMDHIGGYLKPFVPLTKEKTNIGDTEFEKIDESGRYHWRTQIGFVRGFKTGEDGPNSMRGALFGVEWSCNFAEDGSHSNAELDKINFYGVLIIDLSDRDASSFDIERETDVFLEKIEYEFANFGLEEPQSKDA